MKNTSVTLVAIATLVFISCTWKGSQKMKEALGWGGRAVAIDVDPNDANNVWVATPTGGLFSTAVGGTAWGHYDELGEYNCFDVRVDPESGQFIIASCIEDTKVINGGGIWVSHDGGHTWTQPPTAVPKDAQNRPLRSSAFGITFQEPPNNQSAYGIYVGMDSGFAVSKDDGATWTIINPQPNGEKNSIYSMLALNNGRVITFGDHGVWMSDNGLTAWYQDNTKLAFHNTFFNDLLAVSPVNVNHLFLVNDNAPNAIYYSINGGKDWKSIPTDFSTIGGYYGGKSRGVYIKAVNSSSGREDQVDLYCGNGAIVGKRTLAWNGFDYQLISQWSEVNLKHSDNSDMSFSLDGKTIYATNDGGVEKSTDQGATWVNVGNAGTGFDAFQVYDTKIVLSPVVYTQNDLYFGTQDNNVYASPDNGSSWPQLAVPEGGNFQGPVIKSDGYIMTYFLDQGNCRAGAVLSNPPESYLSFPFTTATKVYYVRDKTFMTIGDTDPGTAIFLSSNDGTVGWTNTPIVNINQSVLQHLKLSGPSANPSVFVPVSYGTDPGLVRVDNAFDGVSGNEIVTPIPLPPGCMLANYGYEWIADIVPFGVDPNDPNFLIVSDIANNQIDISTDGGTTWTVRSDITNLITQSGKYFFSFSSRTRSDYESANFQVINFAFDPSNSNHILIGTTEAGAFYSPDHGNTSYKIGGSEQIPNITSFAFTQVSGGEVFASSWGRGLWLLSLVVSPQKGMGAILFPAAMAQGIKNKTLVRGDKAKAERLYNDTTIVQCYFRDKIGIHHSTVMGGSGGMICGARWFGAKTNAPLQFVIDQQNVSIANLSLQANGSFTGELPPLSTGRHTLLLTQTDARQNKKEYMITFTVLPVDRD